MQSETNREEILEEDKYLSRFYYTFGSNSLGQQPFSFGHVLIYARSQLQAHIKFREHFPDRSPRCLNCAGYYTEWEMKAHGNVKSGQSLVKMPSGYKIVCFYFGTDKSAVSCYN